MREADDGADADGGAGQLAHGEGDVVGLDAGGGDVVVFGDGEAVENVGVGHGGVEEGVVDCFGELGEGYGDGVGGGGGGHF